eukprot:6185993-Amphidinium_carterae.1
MAMHAVTLVAACTPLFLWAPSSTSTSSATSTLPPHNTVYFVFVCCLDHPRYTDLSHHKLSDGLSKTNC